MHVCIYTYIYIYIYICMYVCVCIYIYIYIYIHTHTAHQLCGLVAEKCVGSLPQYMESRLLALSDLIRSVN